MNILRRICEKYEKIFSKNCEKFDQSLSKICKTIVKIFDFDLWKSWVTLMKILSELCEYIK